MLSGYRFETMLDLILLIPKRLLGTSSFDARIASVLKRALGGFDF